MGTLSSDCLGFGLGTGLQGCSEYPCPGSEAEVATVKTGSVGVILHPQALLLQLNPSWPAGSMDAAVVAAVAAEGLVGDPSWCEWYEKEQMAAYEFVGGDLVMNPSERGGPGFVGPAAHLVCYTCRHCHLHLKVSSGPSESGYAHENWDG